MRTFRCFDTPEFGCAGVCLPGGCGCEEMASGDTFGADVRGNKALRAYPRQGILIDTPGVVVQPSPQLFTSEQSNGVVDNYASHTWKRFPAGRLTSFKQASCYTDYLDEWNDTSQQTYDLFGCPGKDPFAFPNTYTACGHAIEGEADLHRRVCVRASHGSSDINVDFGGDSETDRMVFAHSEPCIVLDNTRAFGNLWTYGGGSVGQHVQASPLAYSAWNTFVVKFFGAAIHHTAAAEPYVDPAVISLQNAVLNRFNDPTFMDAMNLDRLHNQRITQPNIFDPVKLDRWEATYDALGPGGVGCQNAYLLRTFPGKYEQSGCTFQVDWVIIFAYVRLSLMLYHQRDLQQGQPGNPSITYRVYPTCQLSIHVETALRLRGASGCTLNAPWLNNGGGPIPVFHQPCIRVPRAGTNIANERVIVLVNGKDVELPRFVRWKGERGPDTNPPWSNIYGDNSPPPPPFEGDPDDLWSCCMAHNIRNYKIPGKGQRAAGGGGFVGASNTYNPSGVQHWAGYATIDPTANNSVYQWCGNPGQNQTHLQNCQPPDQP